MEGWVDWMCYNLVNKTLVMLFLIRLFCLSVKVPAFQQYTMVGF